MVFIKPSKITAMNSHRFSIEEARQIDLVGYLQKLGYQPQKIRNNEYWYCSPLRAEKEPSFKVNRRLNVWFDHGTGKGGNFIDFALLYYQCSFKELSEKIKGSLFFHPQISTVQQLLPNTQSRQEALEPTIKVIAAKPLTNPVLCRYLNERKIPVEIAGKYCKEVDFELSDKRFFAIGFNNKSGGFELRNRYFKASSSPKDVNRNKNSRSKRGSSFRRLFQFPFLPGTSTKGTTTDRFSGTKLLIIFRKEPAIDGRISENKPVFRQGRCRNKEHPESFTVGQKISRPKPPV